MQNTARGRFFEIVISSFFCRFWYRCYYPHWSRDSVSPVCGIFIEHIISQGLFLYSKVWPPNSLAEEVLCESLPRSSRVYQDSVLMAQAWQLLCAKQKLCLTFTKSVDRTFLCLFHKGWKKVSTSKDKNKIMRVLVCVYLWPTVQEVVNNI